MADRLKSLRVVDPVLTSIARGYSNAQYIGESLFPIAITEKEGVVVPLFGKESFLLWDTERAIRAASNVMVPDGIGELDVVLREHDLAYPVDYREKSESMFDAESRAAKRVKDAIDLRREYACAALAQNPNSFQAGAKKALSGTARWSGNGGDPIADVEAGKEVIRGRIGKRPNTMVMGASVYQSLKFHTKLQAALGSQERKLVTLEHLKMLFGIDDIQIGEALGGSGAGNKITTDDIWGDNVILAYVAKPNASRNADYEEPSFGYTLRLKGMPETDKYDGGSGGKVQNVRHTDIYKPVIVGADAGYLISDTNA